MVALHLDIVPNDDWIKPDPIDGPDDEPIDERAEKFLKKPMTKLHVLTERAIEAEFAAVDDAEPKAIIKARNRLINVGHLRIGIGSPEHLAKAWADRPGEQRYSLGPVYLPDRLDAHGEWSDVSEIRKMFRDYVALGDRRIRLQHVPDTVAGEWVDAAITEEPTAVTLTLPTALGPFRKSVEVPAGTPFLGTIWTPEIWPSVRDGQIRGYSIGGGARRLSLDLGT